MGRRGCTTWTWARPTLLTRCEWGVRRSGRACCTPGCETARQREPSSAITELGVRRWATSCPTVRCPWANSTQFTGPGLAPSTTNACTIRPSEDPASTSSSKQIGCNRLRGASISTSYFCTASSERYARTARCVSWVRPWRCGPSCAGSASSYDLCPATTLCPESSSTESRTATLSSRTGSRMLHGTAVTSSPPPSPRRLPPVAASTRSSRSTTSTTA